MYRISLHYGRKEEMAYKQELWDEAKKKCRIGDEEIRMANFLRKLRNGIESQKPDKKYPQQE